MPPETRPDKPPTGVKRIALFTGNYNHIADGVSLTLNRLVGYLDAHGHEVMVIAPTVEEPAIEHVGNLVPIPSIPFPGRPEYRLSMGIPRTIRRRIKEFAPDIIHVATPDLVGSAALRMARRMRVPAVASYHTHFISYGKYYGIEWLEPIAIRYLRWFYGRCRQIYVPTESMIEVLRADGIDGNLMLWPRGVDHELFHPGRRSMAWRQSLGFGDDEPVVTFVSRLVLEKGLDVFAGVIERMKERGIAHRSLIVGDGPARKELEERLPDTVFVGHLSGEDLATAYASSDVFLFPSDTETFGNVVLEAMACGLPCICADATGSKSLVDHGVSGFLAPAGNADSFAESSEQLVTRADLRAAMGREALYRARNYYWNNVLARIEGYYDLLA
jgi:phosphatidylinositol alpha 1,6-mannosyltransferase